MKLVITPFIILIILNVISNSYTKEPDIIISAEKKIYDDNKKIWDLIGKPKLQNGKDIITSNTLKYFSKEHKAIGIGNVKLFDYENAIELFGTKVEYLTNNKYAKLMENTKLVSIKNNIVVYSKYVERINTKKYIARKNVEIKMKEENALAKSQLATYEIELNKVILEQKPIIIQNKATYSANKITIFTNTKEVILEGNAKINKNNREIYADSIHYYPKDKNKKTILYGKSKIIEYSDKKSLLKGKPYRYINANEIVFYNTRQSKAILTGNPVINELFIKKDGENNTNISKFLVYKRTIKANTIKYIEGKENKYLLINNAQIYEPNKAAFAKRIDYKEGKEKIAILKGNPVFYVFNESYHLIKDKVKLKGSAEIIKYFPNKEIIIMENNANLIDNKQKIINADYINYNTAKKTGYAKNKVQFKKGREQGSANLTKFVNENKIILQGNAKYTNGNFNAKANYITYDKEKQEAELYGNAIISDKKKEAQGQSIIYKKEKEVETIKIKGKAILTGEQIKAKADNVFYKKEKRKELINLYLNSSLQRKTQSAFAEEILYYTIPINNSKDKKDEKILLKKNVKLISPDREIYGDNAEFRVFANNTEYKEKGKVRGNCQIIETNNQNQAFSDKIEYVKNNLNKEEIILKGNAETNDKDKTAYADKIIFLPQSEKKASKYILTGSPYIQTTDSVTIGNTIELLETNEKNINVIGDAKYFNTEEQIDVFADLINYDDTNKVMRANGNAVYKDKIEKMTAFAQNIIRYEKQKKATALDSVKIVQGKKNIYGNQATYYEEKKEIIIIDETYIVEGNNYAAGDKIILNTEERIVTVFGRREGQAETKK